MDYNVIGGFMIFYEVRSRYDAEYHTLERLDSFVLAVVGKRLTFKELTA